MSKIQEIEELESSDEAFESEEEEDEYAQESRGKMSAKYFLDDIAGEDSSDEEDLSDAEVDDAFIEREEKKSGQTIAPVRPSRLHMDWNPDELVQELNERAKGYMEDDTEYDIDPHSSVMQQSLLPTVRDPKLWTIRCKPGKERPCVIALMAKFLEKEQEGTERLLIKSALSPGHLKGFIYVEAEREIHVQAAVKGIRNLMEYSIKLVPVREMPDVLSGSKKKNKVLKYGDWVRVKKGAYKGDVASVLRHDQTHERVTVKLIPRLHLSNTELPKGSRPPQRFFNPDLVDASQIKPDSTGNHTMYKNNVFDMDGFLVKDMDFKSLEIDNIIPGVEEVQKFQAKTKGENDQEDLTPITIAPPRVPLTKGDNVRVIDGDLVNLEGTIIAIEEDHFLVKPRNIKLDYTLKFTAQQLEKLFRPGEHVKVISGAHEGETGLVVSVSDPNVIIFSDLTQKEITAQTSQLQACSDTASGRIRLGKYALHDLVQINLQTAGVIIKIDKDNFQVLDNNGSTQTISAKEIGQKRNDRSLVAFDIDHNQAGLNDQVRVVDGPHKGKTGSVKHIFKHFLFLHSNDVHDNAGIFVVRAGHCRMMGARTSGSSNNSNNSGYGRTATMASPGRGLRSPGPSLNSGPSGSSGNYGGRGHFVRSNRDWINKTIRLTQGPWKGYIGMVKNATDTTARIELTSSLKAITVPINYLADIGETGNSTTSSFSSSSTWDDDDLGSKTPVHGAEFTPSRTPSRTPVYGTAWDPSATPRTPASEETPQFSVSSAWAEPTPAILSSAFEGESTPALLGVSGSSTGLSGTSGISSSASGSASSSHHGYGHHDQQPTPLLQSEPETPAFTVETPSMATQAWLIPHVKVKVTDAFRGGSYANQTGVIRQVGPDSCVVEMSDTNERISIPAHNLVKAVPTYSSAVIMLDGELKGQVGTIVAIDQQDGIVRVDKTDDITIQNLQVLAIYEPKED